MKSKKLKHDLGRIFALFPEIFPSYFCCFSRLKMRTISRRSFMDHAREKFYNWILEVRISERAYGMEYCDTVRLNEALLKNFELFLLFGLVDATLFAIYNNKILDLLDKIYDPEKKPRKRIS